MLAVRVWYFLELNIGLLYNSAILLLDVSPKEIIMELHTETCIAMLVLIIWEK